MAAWAFKDQVTDLGGTKGYALTATYGLLFFGCHLLPEIDVLSRKRGGQAFLKSHRGMTHSLLFVLAVPWAFASVMFAFQQGITPYYYGALAGILGGLFHLLLDVINPYPMRLFWPFKKRVSLGLVYFRDPVLTLMLIFGLISFRNPQVGLIIMTVVITLTLIMRGCFAIYVRHRFPFFQRHLGREKVQQVAYVPDPIFPWEWKVTILTDDAIHCWKLDVLAGRAIERERFERREAGIIRRARAHELVRALDAHTPYFMLAEAPDEKDPKRTIVTGRDMRFHFYGDENPFRIRFTYEGNKLVEGYFL